MASHVGFKRPGQLRHISAAADGGVAPKAPLAISIELTLRFAYQAASNGSPRASVRGPLWNNAY